MKSFLLPVIGICFVATGACNPELSEPAAVSSTADLNTNELALLQQASQNDITDTPVIIAEEGAVIEPQTLEASDVREPQIAQEQEDRFPWQPANGDKISFKVLRKGNDFGTHSIAFSGDPENELVVTSKVSLRAGFGPITAFRYTLEAKETWRSGVLVKLTGKTNDNGDQLQVSADQQGDVLNVSGSKYSGFVGLGILPSSHWHKGQVGASQILSTEDGELLDVSSEFLGRETIEVAGRQIDADRYVLKSDIDLDLWYDTQNRLVKLAFEARGQNIEYILTQIYGS